MKRRLAAPRAIGVDTGGTFTDFVALVGRRLVTLKLPSTPLAPERAVLEGLARLGAGRATHVRHGSTVATNALLERKGARVVFVTTAGFEDLLEIGRQDRPELYAIAPARVAPLVPAARRIGVRERTGPDGAALTSLPLREAARARRRVAALRPEAIAIGLLHAYANPAHERRLERALISLDAPITRSSLLCPEIREFERFATTVTNAYLMPRVSGYLTRLARGHAGPLEIVLSHGGTARVRDAAREPVRQLLSGPAAGLRAARDAAHACGFPSALSLDVGGTSTDVAFVERTLPRRRAREVAGFPVLLPVLDVHTIGAGGGSIAAVDAGGLLRVGPESAGAAPGPACYGRGGPATLTDALVHLGRIPGETLAGGALRLDRAAAERALGALARALHAGDAATAAEGVVAVAEARMEAALRRVSVEQGNDPRAAVLVAFGGAGGLHACALATALDCRAVVFPRDAGVLSALGALAGGARRERSRSVLVDAADALRLARAFATLEREVRITFSSRERVRLVIERGCEMRYRGQSHELSVPEGADRASRFHAEHRRRFGFAEPGAPVEVVTVEVRAALPADPIPAPERSGRRARVRPTANAPVHHDGSRVRAAVWTRAALDPGARLVGPAIVADEGATLWLPPGWSARVHPTGAIVATRAGSR